MATISRTDWMRMVAALGPAKAEAWRQQQGVEVGEEDAVPTPAPLSEDAPDAVEPLGALSAPEGQPDERAAILKQLQELQQRDLKGFGDEREYRRKLFEQGRASLEKERLGPSRAELPAAVPVCRVAMQIREPCRYQRDASIERNLDQPRTQQACPPAFNRKRQDDTPLLHKHCAFPEADRAHRDLARAPGLFDARTRLRAERGIVGIHPDEHMRVEDDHDKASQSSSATGDTMSPRMRTPGCRPKGEDARAP